MYNSLPNLPSDAHPCHEVSQTAISHTNQRALSGLTALPSATKIMGSISSSGAQSSPKTRFRPSKASGLLKGQYHSGAD
ncbi:hypothetical protein E2C01_071426 [Portunus trituberculatus]|uniref:Uncharacterized protein n=1 Tax=Portunus trituberculatus TaxID=210409 RepID=A0A5B7I532_PORTR|nr:hypothetical protein [Portunus trituberculatus]